MPKRPSKKVPIMASKADRFMSVAVGAARRAKLWSLAATREADRLLREVRKRAESAARRRRLKQTLLKTGRVLIAAGNAALIAGIAAGIAAAGSEHRASVSKKRRR